MSSDLLRTIEIFALQGDEGQANCIDEKFGQRRSRLPARQDHQEQRRELESGFLDPPIAFGQDWLNKLQQYVFSMWPAEVSLKLLAGDGTFP